MNSDNHETYGDEISLRDLYLILKRGLPVILGVALAAALVTFLITSLLPPVFEAESTTLVTPSPIRVQGSENLTFSPNNEVSFEAYETLARSRAVLEEAAAGVPEAELGAGDLVGIGSVRELLGPQRPDQVVPLSVTHVVKHEDPVLAAALADAWAQSTLQTVRNSLLASLNPVDATTEGEVARLQSALEETEARWRSFQERDEGDVLQARLEGLTEQLSMGEARVNELERSIAAARARREALLAQLQGSLLDENETLDERAITSPEILDGLRLFEAEERLNPSTYAQIAFLLERAALGDEGTQRTTEAQILSLLIRTDLQSLEVGLAGLEAERESLIGQLDSYEAQAKALRERIAALNQERSVLGRALENARNAYITINALQPTIAYVTELAPTNARILNDAAVPTEPVGPRRLLSTVLALVLGGMLALLFVFLREAVRAPNTDSEPASSVRSSHSTPVRSGD